MAQFFFIFINLSLDAEVPKDTPFEDLFRKPMLSRLKIVGRLKKRRGRGGGGGAIIGFRRFFLFFFSFLQSFGN